MIKCSFFLLTSLFAVQIQMGGIPLEVEVADTPRSREIGLSGRTDLEEGTGMLFIYGWPQIAYMWMKDTKIPLSVGFFDANQTLINWENMDPPVAGAKNLPTYKSKEPVLYAIEVPKGWFERHRIKQGMKFRFVKNTSPDQANSIK